MIAVPRAPGPRPGAGPAGAALAERLGNIGGQHRPGPGRLPPQRDRRGALAGGTRVRHPSPPSDRDRRGEHWPAGEQPAGQHHPPAGYRPAGQHQPTEGYPPSGEHQPTEGYLPAGQLRPALEDLLGAAAIIAALGRHVPRSAEATATEAVWHEHGGHVAIVPP